MKIVLRKVLIPLVSILAIIGLDQYVKYLVVEKVAGTSGISVIDNVFSIYYVENKGMAWGMMQNKQIFFIIMTPIVVAALLYFYYKIPFEKKFILLRICSIFFIGGALGNAIDRVIRGEELFHGFVVDMFYFELIDFPVFNVADSFITVGFVILVISTFFVYKESDFDMVFGKKQEVLSDNEAKEEQISEMVEQCAMKENENENN